MSVARSFLFAPASRIELADKLDASGADIICFDLEDAVPPDAKDDARAAALPWFAAPATGPRRALRINPLTTRQGLADLHAASAAAHDDALLVLPKVETAAELRIADAALTEAGSAAGLVALVESAAGLIAAEAIAQATPRLDSLFFGAVDFAAETGAEIAPEPLLYARSRLVVAARAAGVKVLDVPCIDFRNADTVAAEARAARAMGFTGKASIHPSNVAIINEAFTPSEAEIARARAVIEAYEASPSGLAVLDGKLVEKPVVRAMQQVMEAARAAGLAP